MLHHVAIEVAPSDVGRALVFWKLLGFAIVDPPAPLAGSATWLEHDGTQIHLMHADPPTVSEHGHIAVVAPDFEATVGRLRDSGFEVTEKRELWGSPRALAIAPEGNRVELMEAPPPPGTRPSG